MKKINIVKKNDDFNRIINSCRAYKYKDYVFYIEKNNESIYRFGFSVGKKIGNAVKRNKIKRQIKSIIDKKHYKNGFNCIIIVRKGIINKSFRDMKDDLFVALDKLDIVKEEINEKK